ncbi:hypothetical protein AXG89_34060 [Burkholderia sp. PAMC 26561]|nr:hypothetical protein AXG89_34060 [Burkholderia sp. PAMC 26561]
MQLCADSGTTRAEITGHGFRTMVRTILREELEHKPEVIEHLLAQPVPDNLGSAYNRMGLPSLSFALTRRAL